MDRKSWMAAGCLLLAAACEKTEPPVEEPLRTTMRQVSVTAAARAGIAPRSQLAPDGYGVLWSPGDRIGVYLRSGEEFTAVNVPLTLEGDRAVATGVFAGELPVGAGAAEYTLYAYYPYSEQTSADADGVRFALQPEQRQAASGSSQHLGDYDFTVAQVATSTDGERWNVAFRHAFGVVEVDLTATGTMAGKRLESVALYATDATTVLSGGQMQDISSMAGEFTFDLTAGAQNNVAAYAGGTAQQNYCRLTFDDPPTLGQEPAVAYLTVRAADYAKAEGQVFAVVRTTDGYTATLVKPGIEIGAGEMKVIRWEVSEGAAPQPVVELSASQQTANCYVAHLAAQEYAFDATVAGNGAVPDALRQAVERYEGRTLTAAIAGSHARLLWQSAPGLIEPGSVVWQDGQIRFATTARPTELGGNAVIALYADDAQDAEAVWSWHIWIAGESNEALQAAAQSYLLPAQYEELYGAGNTRMMDRNLGAIYNGMSDYARSFRAPLYQWGRKDPFPWGSTVYDQQGAPVQFLAQWRPVTSTGSAGQYAGYTGNSYYATAHPEIFIASSAASSFDWYYGAGRGASEQIRNNELWGNPEGYEAGRQTEKTLFDPCPPGWKMPHPYVFAAFTSTGANATVDSGDAHVQGEFRQGWELVYNGSEATYYPSAGYRYDELGVFFFTQSGYYWSSAPARQGEFGGWALWITSTAINTYFSDPRASGLPVRCMRDQ